MRVDGKFVAQDGQKVGLTFRARGLDSLIVIYAVRRAIRESSYNQAGRRLKFLVS